MTMGVRVCVSVYMCLKWVNHYTPVRMAAIQKFTSNKCWRGCAEKGTPLHFGGNVS